MADNLFAVLVGGGIALAGALVNTAMSKRAEHRQKRVELHWQKLEQLAELTEELSTFTKRVICKDPGVVGNVFGFPPAYQHIRIVAALYFPRLLPLAERYHGAVGAFWAYVSATGTSTDAQGQKLFDAEKDASAELFSALIAESKRWSGVAEDSVTKRIERFLTEQLRS